MSRYQMNDASLELPEQFKDSTMHLFTVERNGANAFTFVISRADMEAADSVDTFAQRLVQQMRKTMPRFELKNLRAREIGGETAREVDYVWVSQGTTLHQRQTVVMARGDADTTRRVISFIGTCPNGFTPEWTEEYQKLVGSVKLAEPVAGPFASRMLSADATGLVFVLRDADGSLVVVPRLSQLFAYNIADALDPRVAFFDHAGAPIGLQKATASGEGWAHPDGERYMFWTLDPTIHPRLANRLDAVRSVSGVSSLSSVDAVRRYLADVSVSGLMKPAAN